jgi:hypothetical protein
MDIRKVIFFILIISFRVYSAELKTLGRSSYGDTIQCCPEDKRFIDCSFLKMDQNYILSKKDNFSWNVVKVHEKMSFVIQGPHPVIFKYTVLSIPIPSRSFYSRLVIPENHLIYLIGVDFSDLKPAQLFPDGEDCTNDTIINAQKIVFDFTSNRIKRIGWSDIFAIYSYLVGLADVYSSFFGATNGVAFIFKNNPLSIETRIKLHFLRLMLRLRLLFYGHAFIKYRYVDW